MSLHLFSPLIQIYIIETTLIDIKLIPSPLIEICFIENGMNIIWASLPFYLHEYSLVCVHLQHSVATGDNPLSLSSSSHPSLLAFISPLLCHHRSINLLTLALLGAVLCSSPLLPTYSSDTVVFSLLHMSKDYSDTKKWRISLHMQIMRENYLVDMDFFFFLQCTVLKGTVCVDQWLQASSLSETRYSFSSPANWWASWQRDNEIWISIQVWVWVWGVCVVCNSVQWPPVNCLIDLSSVHQGRLLHPPLYACCSLPSPFFLHVSSSFSALLFSPVILI